MKRGFSRVASGVIGAVLDGLLGAVVGAVVGAVLEGLLGATVVTAWASAGWPASAAEPRAKACEPEAPADASRDVQARSLRIRFSDGREITLVGHHHEDRTEGAGSAEAFRRAISHARSAADLHEAAEHARSENPTAAADAAHDLRYLRTYLSSRPKSFVAVEATPETVRSNLISYGQIHDDLEKKKRRWSERGEIYEEAEASALGADFTLKLSNPALFKQVQFIGAEDRELDLNFAAAMARMPQEGERISKSKFDPAEAKAISSFINRVEARYPSYDPERDEAALLREARAFKSYSKISEYLTARLSLMRAMKLRDRQIARVLLAQSSSGIVFVGRAHLESIAQLLRDACSRR